MGPNFFFTIAVTAAFLALLYKDFLYHPEPELGKIQKLGRSLKGLFVNQESKYEAATKKIKVAAGIVGEHVLDAAHATAHATAEVGKVVAEKASIALEKGELGAAKLMHAAADKLEGK